MPLAPGGKLGPYEILEAIGAGGMGEVYKARDTRLDRTVAIKLSKEQFTERFEREARTVAALNHPNVCTLFDVGPDYLVMEFVEGTMLRGPVPLEQVRIYALQICDALEAAHGKGIVHRDLKPANIRITPEGKVKVLDFGLASFGQSVAAADPANSPTLTMSGVIMGTAGYMSPEQARGLPVDKRADIWAFGLVLYELLTGSRVFAGETVSDLLASVLKTDPDWSRLPPGTPTAIRRLLRRCLVRDRDLRLHDIADARLELMEPFEPAAAPLPGPKARWRPAGWVVAALVLLALAALAVVHFRETRPLLPSTVRLEIPLPSNTTFGGYVSVSPDGRLIVFSAIDPQGRGQAWLRSVDRLKPQPLTGTDDAISFFWSPDSRLLGFYSHGKLQKLDISGGPPQTICETAVVLGGAWSDDGFITLGSNAQGLSRVPAAGGQPVPVTRLDASRKEMYHCWPFFLPGQKHMVYLAGVATDPDQNNLYVARHEAGELKEHKLLTMARSGAFYVASPARRGWGHLLFLRENNLIAQGFDTSRLQIAGEPFPVAEQVGSYLTRPFFGASASGLVAYRVGSATGMQLEWTDRQGKSQGSMGAARFNLDVNLSHDGRYAAVSQSATFTGTDIWLFDTIRGASTRLTFRSASYMNPVWSGDDSWIVFAGGRPATIYRKGSSGAGEEEPLLKLETGGRVVDWSRDGKYLLYTVEHPKTKTDLWALPLEGGAKPWPLLQTEFNETQGQFSPDGHWIAYVSDESGRLEVYVQPFTGGAGAAGGKWQISTSGGSQPRWRGDGKEIFYVTRERAIESVEVRTAPKFRADVPKMLFQTRMVPVQLYGGDSFRYAVTGDGLRFLMITGIEDVGSAPITAIINWRQ